MRSSVAAVVGAVGLLVLSCNLLNTEDKEGTTGRGPAAFDPYNADESGAIRLSLQHWMGCATLATGEVVGKGRAKIPYPDTCKAYKLPPGLPQPPEVAENKPMPVVAGIRYFLNNLSLGTTTYEHTNPKDLDAIPRWFKSVQPWAKLDWRGVSIVRKEWQNSERSQSPYTFVRKIWWGNAAWQKNRDDTWLLELLDADGQVRASVVYDRDDFLVENPTGHHTLLHYEVDNAAQPKDVNDSDIKPAPPPPPGWPPPIDGVGNLYFKTTIKLQLFTSTQPTKSLVIPAELAGQDGAFRVTWSKLPDDPFYFPVTFLDQKNLPKTCYSGTNPSEMVPCAFGVDNEVTFSKPKNGKYYVPGETFQVTLAVKDSKGNYLHHPDRLPSWNEYRNGQSNGITYFDYFGMYEMQTWDYLLFFDGAGPLHLMRPAYELGEGRGVTWATIGGAADAYMIPPNVLAAMNALPGNRDTHIPTTLLFTIPPNAKPGTWMFFFKTNRVALGERVHRLKGYEFQVGQEEPTNFPNRVGNCQICHRGVMSFENIRHGAQVELIEGCKVCHSREDIGTSRMIPAFIIHQVHNGSTKFPFEKNNCSVCHLTRESALRPSWGVCASCHPQPHGTMFSHLEIASDWDPKVEHDIYSDCGSVCHAHTPPTAHILPAELK